MEKSHLRIAFHFITIYFSGSHVSGQIVKPHAFPFMELVSISQYADATVLYDTLLYEVRYPYLSNLFLADNLENTVILSLPHYTVQFSPCLKKYNHGMEG